MSVHPQSDIQDWVASLQPGYKYSSVFASPCKLPSFRSAVLCLGSFTWSWGLFTPTAAPSVKREALDDRLASVCPCLREQPCAPSPVCGLDLMDKVQVEEALLVGRAPRPAPWHAGFYAHFSGPRPQSWAAPWLACSQSDVLVLLCAC